jgi:hypothetical protein
MRGSGAAIQLGGGGQRMEDWGAKTVTTTTTTFDFDDKRSVGEQLVGFLQAALGSPEALPGPLD